MPVGRKGPKRLMAEAEAARLQALREQGQSRAQISGGTITVAEERSLLYTHEEIKAEKLRRTGELWRVYFPEKGPYRRELYPKHVAFLAAGKTHRERLFLSGNQVGKSLLGAYEMTCHLTGEYPDWWPGYRFTGPVRAWAAGDTAKTARGILQVKLLGAPGQLGTGMIPSRAIKHVTHKAGVPGAAETIWVIHKDGGISQLEIKSFDQRRESFQGTVMDVVWLDEEPPEDIYVECLMRTITTGGIVYMTFTPLMGVTKLVLSFLQPGGRDTDTDDVVANVLEDAVRIEGVA